MKPVTFSQLMHRSSPRSPALRSVKYGSFPPSCDLLPPIQSTSSITNRSPISTSCARKHASTASRTNASTLDRSDSIARSRAALDDVLRAREGEQRRAHHVRRAKFSAAGMLISMAIPLLIVMNLNIDDLAKQDTGEDKNGATEAAASAGTVQHQASVPFISKERADSGASGNSDFHGKPVIMQRGTSKPVAHDATTGEDTELVPTDNSTVPFFPRVITLPVTSSSSSTSASTSTSTLPSAVTTTSNESAKSEPYVLLGLGIRTVSFLSIQVYVVGLYVPQSDLPHLQQALTTYINPLASALIPHEKATLKQALLEPSSSEKIWSTVLHDPASDNSPTPTSDTKPIRAALRIVPVRNTDFAHLRDGWVRGITSRTQAAARSSSHEFDDENFGMAMRDFKALFGGKGRAPKGSVMVLARDATGKLEVLMKGEEEAKEEEKGNKDKSTRDMKAKPNGTAAITSTSSSSSSISSNSSSSSTSTQAERYTSLGTVTDERISRLIVMGYLAGKDVSSESARRNIVNGVMGLVERPAGTIETKVE